MEQMPIGASAREGLLLRARLLRPAPRSARALDRGERNDADGRSRQRRSPSRALRSIDLDGAEAEPGLQQALSKAEAIVVLIPPREGAGAALERFGATIATAPGLRRIVYYSTIGVYGDHSGSLGRRDERDADPHRARAGAAGGRGALDGGGKGAGERKRTSCASPASMGLAAMRSFNLRRWRGRGGSSSWAKCSTAPMSMISLKFPSLVLTLGL